MSAPVILVLGPTASGKSALALQLAAQLAAEIISVDSAQIYRGMDIGTAKPGWAERNQVPHHLLDIRDPEETWSAAEFVRHATELIADIQARGRIPLLVGGTMLYFRALIEGIDTMPPVAPEVRSALRARLETTGVADLHRELSVLDPESARRIRPTDPQRILRALEIFLSTGKRLSALQSGPRRGLPTGWQAFALWPDDRAELRERIAVRFEQMLAQGLVEELQRLMARPLLTADHMSQRAVGYRQGWQWLAADPNLEEFRLRSIYATRQLAKRQLTWLRGMPWVVPLPPGERSCERILAGI